VEEPLLVDRLVQRPGVRTLIYVVVIGGVLGLAWLRNRKGTAHKEAMQ
jgi:hypothetical protein